MLSSAGLIFQLRNQFPEDIRQKVTSFSQMVNRRRRNELVANIWNHFLPNFRRTFNERLLEEYRQRSFVDWQRRRFYPKRQDFRGVATTINGNGELIVQLPDGTGQNVVFWGN